MNCTGLLDLNWQNLYNIDSPLLLFELHPNCYQCNDNNWGNFNAKRNTKQAIYWEFKQMAVETMQKEKLYYRVAARKVETTDPKMVTQW